MFGPALDVAQSYLGHFGVGVGEVRRHLRGSVLPSVDLVQDVGQHEVPLAPPARSGCYATQHGLLDGADGALRKVGVAPGHLLLDVPEIHQLLELTHFSVIPSTRWSKMDPKPMLAPSSRRTR